MKMTRNWVKRQVKWLLLCFSLFAFLGACDSPPRPPHLVNVCVAGHWTTETWGRSNIETFVCDKYITQCQADKDFVGAVICGQ